MTFSPKKSFAIHAPGRGMLTRRNILAGLLSIAIAAAGLWISRDYPVGTTLRMSTGYMPRLLLWMLLGLGAIIFVQGLSEPDEAHDSERTTILRPLVFVTVALVVFGLSIERLGLVVSVLMLMAIGSFATKDLRPIETALTAAVLLALSLVIFILGLGLTIPVWPEL